MYLKRMSKGVWVFESENISDIMYFRYAYLDPEKNTLEMIDPEGGPYLSVGTVLEIGRIESISIVKVDGKDSPEYVFKIDEVYKDE